MNEVNTTYFQIKPIAGKPDGLWDSFARTTVMFMNEVFDLEQVRHVSAVSMRAMQHYTFDMLLCVTEGQIERIQYEFSQKSQALKAQRELARAITSTGEFEYVEVPSDAGSDRQLGDDGPAGSSET